MRNLLAKRPAYAGTSPWSGAKRITNIDEAGKKSCNLLNLAASSPARVMRAQADALNLWGSKEPSS
jgi:hypothetical protein